MSSLQLKAQKREKLGSLEAKRIKKSGKVPAVIQSKNGNLNIILDKKEFENEYKKGNIQTRIIEIEIDGKKIKTVTNRVELDPVSDQLIHIDLVNCSESKYIKAWPKVNFIGRDKSFGLKKGGFLNIRTRKIEVLCEKEELIPEFIEIDISTVHIGQTIRSNVIKLADGVKLSRNSEFLIASITGRGKSDAEEAAGAAGAAGANPAGAAGATTTTAAATTSAGAAKKTEGKK